jgi:hypothetical protein
VIMEVILVGGRVFQADASGPAGEDLR